MIERANKPCLAKFISFKNPENKILFTPQKRINKVNSFFKEVTLKVLAFIDTLAEAKNV
jgi:hypothetical protein